MGWRGVAIGAGVGVLLGHSLWGAVFGAWLGYGIEEEYVRRRHSGPNDRRSRPQDGGPRRRDPLAEAYACLGARPSDTEEALRRKYRELAKRYHPDALRARGQSETAVRQATERMSRINAAWALVKDARGL